MTQAQEKHCTIRLVTTAEGVTVEIDGVLPGEVASRVLILEAIVQNIAVAAGEDPAEAAMQLLVAAAHITKKHSDKPWSDVGPRIATALGHAIVAAADWYDAHDARRPN